MRPIFSLTSEATVGEVLTGLAKVGALALPGCAKARCACFRKQPPPLLLQERVLSCPVYKGSEVQGFVDLKDILHGFLSFCAGMGLEGMPMLQRMKVCRHCSRAPGGHYAVTPSLLTPGAARCTAGAGRNGSQVQLAESGGATRRDGPGRGPGVPKGRRPLHAVGADQHGVLAQPQQPSCQGQWRSLRALWLLIAPGPSHSRTHPHLICRGHSPTADEPEHPVSSPRAIAYGKVVHRVGISSASGHVESIGVPCHATPFPPRAQGMVNRFPSHSCAPWSPAVSQTDVVRFVYKNIGHIGEMADYTVESLGWGSEMFPRRAAQHGRHWLPTRDVSCACAACLPMRRLPCTQANVHGAQRHPHVRRAGADGQAQPLGSARVRRRRAARGQLQRVGPAGDDGGPLGGAGAPGGRIPLPGERRGGACGARRAGRTDQSC